MTATNPAEFPEATGRDVAAILDPCPLTIIGACHADGEGERSAAEGKAPGLVSKSENAAGGEGERTAARVGFATVIWAMPVSHKPPMVAFALRAKSHTMSIIRETGRFSLTTLPSDEESVRIVEHCGNNTGHRIDKTEAVEYELIDGLPVPTHALSWELCEVESIREAGDHLLVVGNVLKAASRGSRDEKDRLAPVETLLCIQHGAYAPVGSTV